MRGRVVLDTPSHFPWLALRATHGILVIVLCPTRPCAAQGSALASGRDSLSFLDTTQN